MDLLPKVMLSARLDDVAPALVTAAKTGGIGDAIRIRNDDRGEAAI